VRNKGLEVWDKKPFSSICQESGGPTSQQSDY